MLSIVCYRENAGRKNAGRIFLMSGGVRVLAERSSMAAVHQLAL